MGILNLTPDSFYDGGVHPDESSVLAHVERMLAEGADIIDVGGYSSRPGAAEITEQEEKERIALALKSIRRYFPSAVLSIDTYRAGIAGFAVKEFGVDIINDISAGLLDENMFSAAGGLRAPYIMMHMKGVPRTMQVNPRYDDVVKDILVFFSERIAKARESGIDDIIVDPGFGFGKTVEDNYRLLRELRIFEALGCPLLVGVSRKSMIYKPLNLNPSGALNGTTVLNSLALLNGASILRVHDVAEAAQTIKLIDLYRNEGK